LLLADCRNDVSVEILSVLSARNRFIIGVLVVVLTSHQARVGLLEHHLGWIVARGAIPTFGTDHIRIERHVQTVVVIRGRFPDLQVFEVDAGGCEGFSLVLRHRRR